MLWFTLSQKPKGMASVETELTTLVYLRSTIDTAVD